MCELSSFCEFRSWHWFWFNTNRCRSWERWSECTLEFPCGVSCLPGHHGHQARRHGSLPWSGCFDCTLLNAWFYNVVAVLRNSFKTCRDTVFFWMSQSLSLHVITVLVLSSILMLAEFGLVPLRAIVCMVMINPPWIIAEVAGQNSSIWGNDLQSIGWRLFGRGFLHWILPLAQILDRWLSGY